MSDDFAVAWRERLASGSKLAAKALVSALKEEPTRVSLIVPLLADRHANVRISTLRALGAVADVQPRVVAPHAREIVQGLAANEADAQEAALGALAAVAAYAPAEAALALPLIADLLRSRRPGLREEAARCMGRLGMEVPEQAPDAARWLVGALEAARNPRLAQETREILAALETLAPHLPPEERAYVTQNVTPLRGHPNLQVRERAGRLAKQLAA